ncbi:MAG: HPr family phosphocarrier protein [Brevinema sp.]
MIKRDLHIKNRYGIHARPSSMISDLANNFKSSITIEKEGRTADARNIMSLILLCVEPQSVITAYIDGEDEIEATAALVSLVEERLFDE